MTPRTFRGEIEKKLILSNLGFIPFAAAMPAGGTPLCQRRTAHIQAAGWEVIQWRPGFAGEINNTCQYFCSKTPASLEKRVLGKNCHGRRRRCRCALRKRS